MNFMFIDLINTQWYLTHDSCKEVLEDPEWVDNFMEKRSMKVKLDAADYNRLLKLRYVLSREVESLIKNKEASSQLLNIVNEYLENSTVKRKITLHEGQFKSELVPESMNIEWLIAEIAASLGLFLTDYDITRLKICENSDCKWLFYDETRSKTKIWCDSTCGNLMKVRRHRAKQKS